jgi:hypothetical protein
MKSLPQHCCKLSTHIICNIDRAGCLCNHFSHMLIWPLRSFLNKAPLFYCRQTAFMIIVWSTMLMAFKNSDLQLWQSGLHCTFTVLCHKHFAELMQTLSCKQWHWRPLMAMQCWYFPQGAFSMQRINQSAPEKLPDSICYTTLCCIICCSFNIDTSDETTNQHS